MTMLAVVLAGALVLMPVVAAGQVIFPEPAPKIPSPRPLSPSRGEGEGEGFSSGVGGPARPWRTAPDEDATRPTVVVAQGVFDVPAPPPGGPRPGGPPGPMPRGPRPPAGIGPGAWWKDSESVKKLDLSDAQVGQIEQIYLAHRLRLVDLRADVEKHELGLQPLLDADRPEEAKVAAQIDLITAARGRLEKEHALMLLAIRRTLSVEQWKRLQALQQERARVGIGHAAGRPGGPGFAPGHEAGPRPPR